MSNRVAAGTFEKMLADLQRKPRTLNQCIDIGMNLTSDTGKRRLYSDDMTDDETLDMLVSLEYRLGLLREGPSALKEEFRSEYGLTVPSDCAMLVLIGMKARIQRVPWEPLRHATVLRLARLDDEPDAV